MANFSFKPHLVGLGKEFETEIEDPVELGSRSNSSDVESEREDLIVMDTVTDSKLEPQVI